MAVDWTDDEHRAVEAGIRRYGIRSGMCAALARLVHRVATSGGRDTRGVQLRPKATTAVRFLLPRRPQIPTWGAHTYVETSEHAVDAVTGPGGYAASSYVEDHWHWDDRHYEQVEVDVQTVDPGIQDIGDES